MVGHIYYAADNDLPVTKKQAYIRFAACYLPIIAIILFNQYNGFNIVSKVVAQNDSPASATLLKDYSAKVKEKQQPSVEEQAAADQMMQAIAPSAGNIVLSYIAKLVTVGYYIAMACMVAFTKDKRGPQDLIAKTRVILGKPQADLVAANS